MDVVVSPFHAGERRAQALSGWGLQRPAPIRAFLPEQHRAFFPLLPFLPVATLDGDGAPIATVLEGPEGFVASPDPHTLTIAARAAADDPAAPFLVAGAPVGLIGIDLSTRRRNRSNGTIAAAAPAGLAIDIQQSFGNCPRYIQGRKVHRVRREETSTRPPERFTWPDDEALRQIAAADTFFVASASRDTHAPQGGVDISHRGGRPGFVRVDGATLTIPDFPGNRYFNTLGNLLENPRAALLFLDFESGDVLVLQGTTEIVWNSPGADTALLAGAERVWRFTVAAGWRRRGALALRWTFRDFAPQLVATGP